MTMPSLSSAPRFLGMGAVNDEENPLATPMQRAATKPYAFMSAIGAVRETVNPLRGPPSMMGMEMPMLPTPRSGIGGVFTDAMWEHRPADAPPTIGMQRMGPCECGGDCAGANAGCGCGRWRANACDSCGSAKPAAFQPCACKMTAHCQDEIETTIAEAKACDGGCDPVTEIHEFDGMFWNCTYVMKCTYSSCGPPKTHYFCERTCSGPSWVDFPDQIVPVVPDPILPNDEPAECVISIRGARVAQGPELTEWDLPAFHLYVQIDRPGTEVPSLAYEAHPHIDTGSPLLTGEVNNVDLMFIAVHAMPVKEVLASGVYACSDFYPDCFNRVKDRVNSRAYYYGVFGVLWPNSNTYARQLLEECGPKVVNPVHDNLLTPGWNFGPI